MLKKIVLVILSLLLVTTTVFAQLSGTYTPNNLFYKPGYGSSGVAEWETFNAYLDIADQQITANKDGLALRYLKTEMDTEAELEAILTDVTNLYTNNDFDIADYLLIANRYTDAEAVTAIKADADWHATNWDLAYGWGDHSLEGYLTSVAFDDLIDVNLTGIADKKIVKYDLATSKWIIADDDTGTTYTAGTGLDLTGTEFSLDASAFDLNDFPADPDADRYLFWNDTTGALTWAEGSGSGVTTFVGLTDTPLAYTGYAGYFPKVNAGETALEFAQLTSDDLSDVDSIGMLDENETVTGWWSFEKITIARENETADNSPYINFNRSRSVDVLDGDTLGKIVYFGSLDSYGILEAASIKAYIDGTPGDADMPGRLEFYTTPDGSATPTLRLAIDNAGNIKMGDGAWTNYANFDSSGNLTFEGAASINEPLSIMASTTSAELAGVISDETGTGALVFANSPSLVTPALGTPTSGDLSNCTGVLHNIVEDTTPKLGGELDAGAHTIGFTQQTVTYNATTTTVDWKLGNKASLTLTGNVETLDFVNPSNPCNILLKIVQDATGSRTITNWDADIKWAGGGTAPTLSTGANAIDIVTFYFDGTYYYGVASLDFQ